MFKDINLEQMYKCMLVRTNYVEDIFLVKMLVCVLDGTLINDLIDLMIYRFQHLF